jgi:hypothetical protein
MSDQSLVGLSAPIAMGRGAAFRVALLRGADEASAPTQDAYLGVASLAYR